MSYSVVVVAWNGAPWIDGCLESILDQEGDPAVIVVDNGSADDTVARAKHIFEDAGPRSAACDILCLDHNYGFPIGANRGMEAALAADRDLTGVLLLNQDARLEPGALAAFARFMEDHPKAGALGAKILYPDRNSLQHAGGYLDRPRMVGLHFGHHEPADQGNFSEPREVDYVTGAAIMLRARCLRDLGLFEELFSPGYYEDVELCDRLKRNGWPVFYVPEAAVIHEESSSFTDRDLRLRLSHRNRLIFALSHAPDPAAAKEFVDAETDFLVNDAHRDEVRAISSAALEYLTMLPAATCSRTDNDRSSEDGTDSDRQTLVALRKVCRDILVPRLTRLG